MSKDKSNETGSVSHVAAPTTGSAHFILIEHVPKLGWWYVGNKQNIVDYKDNGDPMYSEAGMIFDNAKFRPADGMCPDLSSDDLEEIAALLASLPAVTNEPSSDDA